MKKVLFAAAIIAGSLHTKAQSLYVQGGANFANISNNNDGSTDDSKTLVSFNAGLLTRFDISSVIDLETGLLLTGKGAKAESYFNNGADYVKAKFNPLYVELPVNVVVKFPLENKAKTNVFVYAGPYAAVGVGGKSKFESKIGPLTSSSESSIKFNNDDPLTSQQEDASFNKLKRFDFGLNGGAGIQLRGFMVKANYGFGLAKINSTQTDNNSNDKNKYRTASVSIGIPLGN